MLLLEITLEIEGEHHFERLDSLWIARVQDIDVHSSADHVGPGERRDLALKPIRRRSAVKVNESENDSAGRCDRRVARGARSLYPRGDDARKCSADGLDFPQPT